MLLPGNDQSLPTMPDQAQVTQILFDMRSQVFRCAPGVMVPVRFQVAGSTGHARQIELPNFTGTPEQARCIQRALRTAAFPRFRMLVFPVQHIFPR